MRRLAPTLLVLIAGALAGAPARGQEPCDRLDCAGHGECMMEGPVPFCFCEDGYMAEELACVPATDPPPSEEVLRSPRTGARIVRIAAAEDRRPMGAVGRHLAGEPGPLRRYVTPRELWCTDFVSWVYRVAGVPFTGGADGGWHLSNNHAVRAWFRRGARWIANRTPEWERFAPEPGDYVRFHTRSYGHSGIVERVRGDALHTIEGNPMGQVERRRYPAYRGNPRIDGFGIVTRPAERIALLRSAP